MIPILRMVKKTDEDYQRGFRWEIVFKNYRYKYRKFATALKEWRKALFGKKI